MELILPAFTGLCLSACTGFRAFLPPLILGLLAKFLPAYVNLNQEFAFLTKDPVLITLGLAALFEFLGDKIPWVDHLLDQLNLPAKIILSGVLTFALIPSQFGWFYYLIALVFAETATLTVHTGKTGIRMSSTATTGGVANPIIGFLEDAFTLGASLAAVLAPILGIILVLFVGYKCFKFLFGKKGGNDGEIAKAAPSFGWYTLSAKLSYWLFKTYNRMTVTGREHIPEEGPFVIVANHASILDGFILGGASDTPLFIMVKKESFENPITGWYLRKVLCFPVDRSKADSYAIRRAMKVLNDGYNLGLFPEGTRNREGKVSQFKSGAIRFATKKKVPIIPAYIGNAHLLTPQGTTLPRPAKLSVDFLPAVNTAQRLADGKTEDEILDEVYNLICDQGTKTMGYEVREELEPHETEDIQEIAAKEADETAA